MKIDVSGYNLDLDNVNKAFRKDIEEIIIAFIEGVNDESEMMLIEDGDDQWNIHFFYGEDIINLNMPILHLFTTISQDESYSADDRKSLIDTLRKAIAILEDSR